MINHNREEEAQSESSGRHEIFSAPDGLDLETLTLVIHMIAQDFKIPVKVRGAGVGSYYDIERRQIVLDPEHLKRSGLYVPAHEAAHVVITVLPNGGELVDLLSNRYFQFLWNVTEDTAVDTWLLRRYPGLRDLIRDSYSRTLEEASDTELSRFDKSRQVLRSGRIPKSVLFASEIFRLMFNDSFSEGLNQSVEGLDQSVIHALDKVRTSLVTVRDTIPNPKLYTVDPEDVKVKAQKRIEITRDEIWPEFQKLLMEDIEEQAIVEMIMDVMRNDESPQCSTQTSEAASCPRQTGASQGADIQISSRTKNELREASQRPQQKALEALNRQLRDEEAELSRLERCRAELQTQMDSLTIQGSKVTDQHFAEGELMSKSQDLERLLAEIKKHQKEVEEIKEAIEEILNNAGSSVQLDELTPEAREELMEAFSKLPKEYQKELRERAEGKMSRLLSKLDEEMKPKWLEELQSLAEESHELDEVSVLKINRDQVAQQSKPNAGRISPPIRIIKQHVDLSGHYKRSEVEEFIHGLRGLAEDLRRKIENILRPQDLGSEERGFPSGQMLDMTRAMQAEVDHVQKTRLWTRPVAPSLGDYSFYLVIDLSGSMKNRVEETIKGATVVTLAIEPLERKRSGNYGIELGILGFHNDLYPIKDLGQTDSQVYSRLYSAKDRVNDANAGTNTLKATEYALECIKRNPAQDCNFILTFTDGEPNSDVRAGLRKLLMGIRNGESSNGIRIETALIMLGENYGESGNKVKKYCENYGYKQGFALPTVDQKEGHASDFPFRMAELIKYLLHREHTSLMER